MTENLFTINQQLPEESFNRIANELFKNHCITTHKETYLITEIEFYFKSPNHDDPTVHQSNFQRTNGCWYFHWAGIDITIGDGENYGGVLIRGVKKRIQDGNYKYTNGPINVMQEMLSAQNSVFSENGLRLQLTNFTNDLPIEMFRSKRIGLHSSSTPTVYIDKLYRYVIDNIPAHPFKQRGTIKGIYIQ